MKKIIAIILTIAMVLPCFCVNVSAQTALERNYDKKMALVTERIMNDKITLKKVEGLERAVVYISVSDSINQAVTVCSSTKKLEASLEKALVKANREDLIGYSQKCLIKPRGDNKNGKNIGRQGSFSKNKGRTENRGGKPKKRR